MDLWIIFLTGLTVGGLTCLAVQGGLLASVIASREEADDEASVKGKHTLWPTVTFLITKLISYTLLGFALGAFGLSLKISDSVRIWMQFLAGFYMVAVALNLLNVHPIFRYVVIQPPRFLTRLVRKQSKSKDLFAPALLGLMTIFIPCGSTLAMEAYAIASSNPWQGAAIMAAFTLGTFPLFFGVGFLTTKLGDAFKSKFYKLAAIALIYLGVTSINSGLVLSGSDFTLESLKPQISVEVADQSGDSDNATDDSALNYTPAKPEAEVASTVIPEGSVKDMQVRDIQILSSSYNPKVIKVKAGAPVQLNLTTKENYACTSIFVIPKLKLSKELPPTGTESVTFMANKPGKLLFTCSMGMFTGVIEVT